MLDLLKFFQEAGRTSYCVVKMSRTFPLYRQGEDVDIFCYSVADFTKKILAWGNDYVKDGYSIQVTNLHQKQQLHVDLLKDEGLQFRFDLYGELPVYKKLMLKPALFESVIENAQTIPYQAGSEMAMVKIPSRVDDLLIRYLEFMEYYDVRPSKLKHLEFIMEQGDQETRERLLEKLHHYTRLPPIYTPQQCPFCRLSSRIKKYLPG